MRKLALLATLVLAAACGPKSTGNTADPCKDPCKDPCADPKMAAMTCEKMGENVAAAMQGNGEMGDIPSADLSAAFANECTSSAWSQDIIDCMAAASSPDTAESCAAAMSDEQRQSLDRAMESTEESE